MKLSEAIRLGAMLHPQGFEHLSNNVDGVIVTCALGAAWEAGYKDVFGSQYDGSPLQRCPVCAQRRESQCLANLIVHLNDDHRWAREKIADWVETVEPSTSPAREVAPALADDAVAAPADEPQAVTSRC